MTSDLRTFAATKPHIYSTGASNYYWCVQWVGGIYVCAMNRTPKEAYDKFMAKAADFRLVNLPDSQRAIGSEQQSQDRRLSDLAT